MTSPAPAAVGFPETPAPAGPATKTVEDLVNSVLKESGLDKSHIDGLKFTTKCTAAGLTWSVNQPKQNDPSLSVLFMFKGDQGVHNGDHIPGDIRIYAAPNGEASSNGAVPPFSCFTTNRQHPTFVGESMSFEAFVRSVADEVREQALLELDLTACEGDDCNALTNASAEKCRLCGSPLLDSPDDDEDDDEDDAPEEAAPITSIGGVSLQGIDITNPKIVQRP
jgi:hypothetical protein